MAAIEAHKRTMRRLRALNRECDRLDAMPGRRRVEVLVGRVQVGRDDEGNRRWSPIYAYSHHEIDAHFDRHCQANEALRHNIAPVQARRLAAHRELTNIIRANAKRDRLLGILDVRAQLAAAYAAENVAAVALILTLPTTTAEAKMKAAYMGRRSFGAKRGDEWWNSDARMTRIFTSCCAVAGEA